MYCPNCGKTNSAEQKFCRSCGLSLEKAVQSLAEQLPGVELDKNLQDRQRRVERWLNILAAGGISLFVVAILWAIELVTRHIVLRVSVNNSRPLSFVLDTGNKFAVIDLDRARELGLNLQGQVRMHGAGPETFTGALVRDSSFTISGFDGFSQPVRLALPVARLASRFGQDFDGIIGTDFIKEFVVEVDYQARLIRLHDKNKFTYTGSGESIPIQLDSAGHPIIDAEVTPIGSGPIKGKFA